MNKRGVGTQYERTAALALQKRGVKLLEMNYRCKEGEIDIIALDGDVLCYIEVKYRSSCRYGLPEEAVDHRKRQTIKKVAAYYQVTHQEHRGRACRFDMIAIVGQERMTWHKNAF